MNKIMVTGPRGFLGATLVQAFSDWGYEVVPLEVDVSDAEAVMSAVLPHSDVVWIIHTAAITSAKRCEEDRPAAFVSNVSGTKNIRDAAEAIGAKLLYVSTVSVFSCFEGGYTESDLPYPKNYYSLTKYLGEIIAGEYAGTRTVRLSLLGMHPGGSRGQNFFEWLVGAFTKNEDVKLFSDVYLNPISNWTTAALLREIIERNIAEPVLHLGTRQALSKAEIGREVMKAFPNYSGAFEEAKQADLPAGVYRPTQMVLAIKNAEAILGHAMPSLEDEIKLCVQQAR